METINNMASAASKAVWGDSTAKEEPVSGQQGDTSKGEPFDKGNEDSAAFAKNSGTAAESDDVPNNPSTNLKAKDTPQDSTKGQNDVRSPDDPQTNPKNAPTDVDNTEQEGVNSAQKLDGPGPLPLEEVARRHGGDAGKSDSAVDKVDDKPDDKPDAESKESKGTGEKYVKSTGLQADGGDFDATKPGAGREADRLLEEKGIHHDKPGAKPDSGKDPLEEKLQKKSLKEKIKEKFHKN